MAQHIFTGAGAPSTTPTAVGQHYIDTTNKNSYISVGTSSSADWELSDAATVSSALSSHTGDSTIHFIKSSIDHLNIQNIGTNTHAQLDSHVASTANPHSVTKAQIGLSSVPNIDATQRANHTGTQLASTISDFSSATRAVTLTGLSISNAAITSADTVLSAFGKLQGQANRTAIYSITSVKNNSSAVTGVTVTEFNFAVTAGKSYYLEYKLAYIPVSAFIGLGTTLVTSGGAAGTVGMQMISNTNTSGSAALIADSMTSFGSVITSINNRGGISNHLYFGLVACTTSGSIDFQFFSEVTGNNVALQPGSHLVVREF